VEVAAFSFTKPAEEERSVLLADGKRWSSNEMWVRARERQRKIEALYAQYKKIELELQQERDNAQKLPELIIACLDCAVKLLEEYQEMEQCEGAWLTHVAKNPEIFARFKSDVRMPSGAIPW